MNPGLARLILRVTKWLIIPSLLILIGFVLIGPALLPKLVDMQDHGYKQRLRQEVPADKEEEK
jgi:hypothetical protein